MDIVYFVYTLAFLALGFAILLRSEQASNLSSNLPLRWLSAFGFVHGLREAMALWEVVHGTSELLYIFANTINLASLVCLIEFGRRLIMKTLPNNSHRTISPFLLYPAILLLMTIGIITTSNQPDGISGWIRICFLLPGAFLTALGCFRFAVLRIGAPKTNPELPRQFFAWIFLGCSFVLYGIFAGITIQAPPWMVLIPWLSNEGFMDLTHIPVELIRAFCAVAIMIMTIQVLRISRLELILKLEHARTLSNLAVSARNQISNRFETALNYLSEGVVCVDLAGNVEYTNWPALFILGYESAESINGKNFFELCLQGTCTTTSASGIAADEKYLRSRITTGNQTGVIRRSFGTSARVRYRISPIFELKKLTGAVVVFSET